MMHTKTFLLAALLVGTAMMPSIANAKTALRATTCMGAIDAADKAGQDWTTLPGADGLYSIDGENIRDITELAQALIAAKQDIPLVRGGNFSSWDFRNQQVGFSGVCFYETDLSKSKWDDVNGFGNGFIKVNLEGASFSNAGLEKVLLREANLQGTKMLAAKLSGGRLDGGWDGSLENWDLTGANLTGFHFACGITISDGCALDRAGVKFTGAILTNADLSQLPFWGQADYYGAILDGTILSPNQIVDMNGANFSGPVVLSGGGRTAKLTPTEMVTLVKEARAALANKARASFYCAKAATAVEKLICRDGELGLRELDRKLAGLYNTIRPKNPAMGTDQKAWLTKRRRCKNTSCLADLYDKRIDELVVKLGPVELLQPGQSALYIEDRVPFPNSFTDSPLYAKITLVLVGASTTEAVLTRDRGGSYTLMGASFGANAHVCTLAADGAMFNPKTGWFSVEEAPVFRAVGDAIEIIGSGHPDDAKYPGSSDHVSCGMRAMFSPMKPIKVDTKLLRAEEATITRGME